MVGQHGSESTLIRNHIIKIKNAIRRVVIDYFLNQFLLKVERKANPELKPG